MLELPAALDLGATFLFALTGALSARRKGYDFIGVLALALGVGVGGGLIRDGVLMARTPAAMQDPAYVTVVAAAAAIGIFFGRPINRLRPFFDLADALGLGLYTVVGVQKGLAAGFGPAPAVLTGVVSAVGGGLLRDLLSREEPVLFKPGHLYAAASILGGAFLLGVQRLGLPGRPAAYATIGVVFLLRMLSVWLNWRSRPVESLPARPG
jgi:uncharacterized membrane protein YeiH